MDHYKLTLLCLEHFWRGTVFSANSGGELKVAEIRGIAA